MLIIYPIEEKDRSFVIQALTNLWGSKDIVYSGVSFDGGNLPGFLAKENERIVGLLTYKRFPDKLQIISLNALTPGKGIGTALIEKVKETARHEGIKKLLVVTTNDNLSALNFYKRKGFIVSKIKKGAVALSRKIKPEISLVGESGLPIEDEIELEKIL